jgi:hypothetical protein
VTRRSLTPFLLAAAAALQAPELRAERLFVGVVEADSCQSVTLSVSAFGRYADLPGAADYADAALASALSVPSLAIVAPTERLQVVQTLDLAQPRSDSNPANVAIVPLGVARDAFLNAFRSAYSAHRRSGPFTVYERPSDTNLPARVAVGVEARYAFTSPSVEALQWAWDNRARLVAAPAQSLPGTLRALANPQRLADALGGYADQAAPLLNVEKLIRDFDTLSLSLSFEGQAVTATLCGKPSAGAALERLVHATFQPSDRFWRAAPSGAFLSSVSANREPALSDDYLGALRLKLLRPAAGLLPADAYTGERLLYVAPTADKRGVCVAYVEPLTNAPLAAAAIKRLDGVKVDDAITLKRGSGRTSRGAAVEAYTFSARPPAAGKQQAEPDVLSTLLSVLLRDAVLETAVWSGSLVTVVGSTNALDDVLDELASPGATLSLRQRISVQDSALSQGLLAGGQLRCAGLIRHLVAIMPGVQPEHLRVLPESGDGLSLGFEVDGDGRLVASLRIQTNEIAALQRINRDGREVLQELFFQMFSSRLLDLQRAAGREAAGAR